MKKAIKISFGMIVVNGEPFIRYNLENLYPHAHEILVVEGAVEKFRHAATKDGHSIDNTVRIIREFPDPERKIKLIQRDGFWPEKDDMSNAYMACCTSDYIWQVDVDEFYKTEDIEKVRSFLTDHPDVTRIDLQTVNFWKGFKAVMQGASYCFGADQFRRVFRFRPGYRFLTHRPPTVIDAAGRVCGDTKVVSAEEMVQRFQIFVYHYSYVFTHGVETKADYYSRMGWGQGHEDGLAWAKGAWSQFSDPLRVHLIDFPPSWIVPFQGTHPDVIVRLMESLDFRENDFLEEFLRHEWERYARIGNYVCEICKDVKSGRTARYFAALQIFKKVIFQDDAQASEINRFLVRSAFKIARGRY